MAITYDWNISQLECYPEHEGEANVVFTIHWRYGATDGDYFADVYGSQGVSVEIDPENFIAYEDLTKADVVGWLEDVMGAEKIAEMKANLASQIDNLKNPPVVRPSLPWA